MIDYPLMMALRSWWWRRSHPAEHVGKERPRNGVPHPQASIGGRFFARVWWGHMDPLNDDDRWRRRVRSTAP